MIYLDHHAATPLCVEAREAMDAARDEAWANPSSAHAAGRAARAHLERARRCVAESIGAQPADIVLTSGGTEAINAMILGRIEPRRIVTSALEHPAVRASVDAWRARGVEIEVLSRPDAPLALHEADLLALQWVSHETGSSFDLGAQAERARAAGAHIVVDATQAYGRHPIDVQSLGVHALAIASHKIGGPSGAGALWISREHPLQPSMHGGGQERGRRGGSPDLMALIGFGAAASAIGSRLAEMPRVGRLRDRLESACVALGGVVNGTEPRVASVTNASFRGWKGEVLVAALDLEGLCTSFGAACSSGVAEPSPVIAALHPDEPWRAESCVRMSLGPELARAEIDDAIAILEKVLRRRVS